MARMTKMYRGQTSQRAVLSAVVRRFPHFELTIRRMVGKDETFRDICEEFAEAEFALSQVERLPTAVRDARRAEWQEMVDRLAEEIEEAATSQETSARSRHRTQPPR